MTAEGDKFKISAGRAGIHGAAKRGVAAMDHFFYIFNDRVTGMLDIEHFFKMIEKYGQEILDEINVETSEGEGTKTEDTKSV